MRPSDIDRFWGNVDKSGECWLWTGRLDRYGYGDFRVIGGHAKAHRVAYELGIGPIPEGMLVCHRCDNRACVRPDHLFHGTASDNARDSVAKGRWITGVRIPPPPHDQRGQKSHTAKLSDDAALSIRTRYLAKAATQQELATEYGVHKRTIQRVLSSETWGHVS